MAGDIAQRATSAKLVHAALESFGRLDVVVNADAADLTQEALRVVTRISQFAARSSLRTWA